MHKQNTAYNDLKALFINCSIKQDKAQSHTQTLMDKAASVMSEQGVKIEHRYALDYEIAFGMVKDGNQEGQTDDWPMIQQKIMDADILVIGTPIWLGAKSSVATQVIERMYAYSGDMNHKNQYAYYGKTGGCVITGNEDGAKHCAMDILYAMGHIGYTIPPQADCAWLGEAGPGPSYGDTEWDGKVLNPPAGFDNQFTNRNTTFMAWNLMHMARLLKDNNGLPAVGNTTEGWQEVTNAASDNPEYR
ncbi:MAG: flavodoxin family protein [Candidatus Saccharibacteria bacterium]|nr:flavodoxin family protein [Candidatus Saccharibacteria bacterium]